MRNKSYYLLFVLYILMFGFILFINGVFTGQVTSKSNLIINIAFLVLIGILMVIAAVHFTRLNQVTDALVDAADAMQQNRGVIERRQAALYRAFAQLLQQRDEADGVCRLMQKIECDQRDIEDLLE